MPLFSHGSRRTSGTSCGRSQHPAWTSQLPPAPGRNSHLSSLCGEGLGGTSHGDGTCPHRQRMSTQGQKTTLGKKTPFPPCRGILPPAAPMASMATQGPPDQTSTSGKFQGPLLWDRVRRATSNSSPGVCHPHPILTHCAGLGQLLRPPARLLWCCLLEPSPAWRSLALYFPLWGPVPLSSKEKGSLSDSHPP